MFEPPETRRSIEPDKPGIVDLPVSPVFSVDGPMDDWELLLGAVQARLKATVAHLPAASRSAPERASGLHIQDVVLDCMRALDQIHLTLRHELRLAGPSGSVLQNRGANIDCPTQAMPPASIVARTGESSTGDAERRRFLALLSEALRGGIRGDQACLVLRLRWAHSAALDGLASTTPAAAAMDLFGTHLIRALRQTDTVIRVGHDEFACLLTHSARLEGPALVARLRTLLDSASVRLTQCPGDPVLLPSIGIARWPLDGLTVEQLMHHAAEALAHA